MAKQAIKKGSGIKKTNLSSFKEKMGLTSAKGGINTNISNASNRN